MRKRLAYLLAAVMFTLSLACFPQPVRADYCEAQAEEIDLTFQLIDSATEAFNIFADNIDNPAFIADNFGYIGDYNAYLDNLASVVYAFQQTLRYMDRDFIELCQ